MTEVGRDFRQMTVKNVNLLVIVDVNNLTTAASMKCKKVDIC